MRYPASQKLEIIKLVEHSHLPVKRIRDMLGIPRTGVPFIWIATIVRSVVGNRLPASALEH